MKHRLLKWCGLPLMLACATTASAQTDSAPASAAAVPTMAPATLAGFPATSEPVATVARKTRVAVPNMVTSSGDTELAKTLTQVLTIEVNKVRGIEAIGMADIEALLNHEQQKQLLGCEDASCIAEIGGALGVDALLSSSIGKVGGATVLSIRLNDVHSARQIGSAYETVKGSPEDLIKVIQRKVPEVMREAQPAWAVAEDEAAAKLAADQNQPHLVWPAIGVAGAGVALLAGATGLAIASAVVYGSATDNPQEVAGATYTTIGSQADVATASYLGYGGLAALGLGLIAVAAGATWQLLAGGGVAEVAP